MFEEGSGGGPEVVAVERGWMWRRLRLKRVDRVGVGADDPGNLRGTVAVYQKPPRCRWFTFATRRGN